MVSSATSRLKDNANRNAVDVMVIIGNEKLTIEMQKMFTKNGVTVISAPKSGGVSIAAQWHRITPDSSASGCRARRNLPQPSQESADKDILLW